jgi:hypothetical protein
VKKIFVAVAMGALIMAAVAIASPSPREMRRLVLAPSRHAELGLLNGGNSSYLVRVDPRTLRPRGRGLDLPGCSSSPTFAPDRARLALGGPDGRICLIRTKTLRLGRVLQTRLEGDVPTLQWLGSSLLALVWGEQGMLVAAVDTRSGQVISTRSLEGSMQQTAPTPAGMLLLLGPAEGIGVSRLLRFQADGTLAEVATLDRIPSGSEFSGRPEEGGRHARPGLAVDRSGDRAFVVGGGTPVAEVDLKTSNVVYHDLARPVSLLGKVHDWLEPPAEAKVPPEGPSREAIWLGGGLLAVSGWNDRKSVERDQVHFWAEPAGITLVDTHSWSSHLLDGAAQSMTVASGNLLTFSALWDSALDDPAGSGLTAYGPGGNARFHLFGSRAILSVQTLGNRAFVRAAKPGYSVIDLDSGRILHRFKGEPPELLLP